LIETRVVTSSDLNKLAKAFKDAEIRIPQARMKGVGQKLGKILEMYLLQPTAGWSHKPKSKVSVKSGQKALTITATIDDAPYVYVAMGTPAHVINIKHAPRLVFQQGYNAKTVPGSLVGVAGGKFGDIVYTIRVFHPGVKARGFQKIALNMMAPVTERILIAVLTQELKHITQVV